MTNHVSNSKKRRLCRGESGQVIVILALGFIILLAFVGIVTDVSLMFVRYNTLRRAVDAASVAAAGQVRKTLPNPSEIAQAGGNMTVAEGYAAARNYAALNLAARQFIEFYGLTPTNVTIETCASRPGDPELCTPDQRKLVRVIAQVDSPTVFLRLLGWPTLTLEATAIAETAVLDVVIIMDASESMGEETTYAHWQAAGYTYGYLPPRLYEIWATNAGGYGFPTYTLDVLYDYIYQRNQNWLESNNPFRATEFALPGPVGQRPRETCQVTFFPSSSSKNIPDDMLAYFRSGPGGPTYAASGPYAGRWDGFQTQQDYFGCCNDPNGNGMFEDLVCQPFRSARDATQEFLNRIDFIRGDRVAFVTYDREATIIDPDGNGPQSHMIDNSVNAQATLRDVLGVRATDDFYADTDNNGAWDAFVIYPTNNPGGQIIPFGSAENYFENTTLGQLTDYPVKDSCTFQNAVLPDYYSPFVSNFPQNNPPGLGLLYGYHANTPLNPNAFPGWPASQTADRGYQRWAQCRGGNIGAALRAANDALSDQTVAREQGSVWIMVLLSDGAAGASDPVYRNSAPTNPAVPYPPTWPPPAGWQPYGGEYGAYGLCPYQGAGNELGDIFENPFVLPFCADEIPETRHFCIDRRQPRRDPNTNAVYVELNDPGCMEYDVDDHARDWADMVSLLEFASGGEGVLPTIFTIGFGLEFEFNTTRCASGTINYGPAGSGRSDVLDCLGEEMLRYLADVGDNFELDTNYQQDLSDDRFHNDSLTAQEYGARGPCEDPAAPANSNSVAPLRAGESCGNYYNAPTAAELELVFDDIASRMFTRLAR
jgi:Flp pilus assembly protein TadG